MSLLEAYNTHNAFGRFLNMHFEVITPGQTRYHINIQKEFLATPKAAHGGLISALVDASLGTAALSAVAADNKVVSTVEYKLNFLKPSFEGDALEAIGTVITQGKRILVVKCDVFCVNRDRELIATALGTFNAYDAVKAGM